jgi:hypothetical protein
MSTRPNREIHVRHAEGAPEAVISAVKTERELQRLIAGEGAVDKSQISEVVKKLQVVIADYLEGGHDIDIRLTPLEIISAVEAAIQEASGKPSPWPDGADARTFFIHGLYDELIQQPSNIFETKLFPDGSTRYVPIARAVWKACLERLRDRLADRCN